MRTLAFLTGAVILGSINLASQDREAAPGAVESKEECAVSRGVLDTPPKDPNADPFGSGPWHITPIERSGSGTKCTKQALRIRRSGFAPRGPSLLWSADVWTARSRRLSPSSPVVTRQDFRPQRCSSQRKVAGR